MSGPARIRPRRIRRRPLPPEALRSAGGRRPTGPLALPAAPAEVPPPMEAVPTATAIRGPEPAARIIRAALAARRLPGTRDRDRRRRPTLRPRREACLRRTPRLCPTRRLRREAGLRRTPEEGLPEEGRRATRRPRRRDWPRTGARRSALLRSPRALHPA